MSDLPEHPIPGAYWVRPRRLLAGPHPGSVERKNTQVRIESLLDVGVTFFIDLTEQDELEPYDHLLPPGVTYRRLPIRDKTTPTPDHMRRILTMIDAGLMDRMAIYVHCWAGLGRTGTVIGCHLVRYGLSGTDALAEIIRLRGGQRNSPETEPQRNMVRTWCESRDYY